MSYQVLARKYRPQTFEDVVGQEAVVTTLKNAIASQRLHHAYLFAGARGIGKTSLARIFAKALNCEKGPTPTPCNQCSLCREITDGTSLDVQEIDGASNTSVDDVRELRERLKYLPAGARYKIFIIDEVHMLSGSAFNALLKTLEEPPPHVIFLFATTEIHKIPATILSRCQRFDLRRIPTERILAQLQAICEREKVKPDPDALLLIAREAEGSLRDAQSLLDQSIAYAAGDLNAERISSMLGLVNTGSIHRITDAVLRREASRALDVAQEIFEKGHDLKQFAIQWLNHWKNLLIYKATSSEQTLKDFTEAERVEAVRQSGLTDLTVLDVGFNLLQRGGEEIARSEFPKMILDVLVVRLAHASELADLGRILEDLKTGGAPTAKAPETSGRSSPAAAPTATPAPPSDPKPSPAPSSALGTETETPFSEDSVKEFLKHVSSKRPQVGSLLSHVRAFSLSEKRVILNTDPGSLWMDLLSERKALLEEMAAEFFGRPLQVLIQEKTVTSNPQAGSARPAEGGKGDLDSVVDSALNILNAKLEEVNP
jgi:DNA polymerase III subunit gamma/tau